MVIICSCSTTTPRSSRGNGSRRCSSTRSRTIVGGVGAKLLYPDGRIQHIGVVMGVSGMAAHAFHGHPGSTPGYGASAWIVRNYSVVTAACMMTRRELYERLGGIQRTIQARLQRHRLLPASPAGGLSPGLHTVRRAVPLRDVNLWAPPVAGRRSRLHDAQRGERSSNGIRITTRTSRASSRTTASAASAGSHAASIDEEETAETAKSAEYIRLIRVLSGLRGFSLLVQAGPQGFAILSAFFAVSAVSSYRAAREIASRMSPLPAA